MMLTVWMVILPVTTASAAIQPGLHDNTFLTELPSASFPKAPNYAWASVDRNRFELPAAEDKLLQDAEKENKAIQKLIEGSLETGKFQKTSSGKYFVKQEDMLMSAALQQCQTLNGTILAINSKENPELAKGLLGEDAKMWQSQLQTPAATYFLPAVRYYRCPLVKQQ